MMRKCFSLLIRLLVKITKLSKATQETTQPISPITSQINGPAENNAYGLKKYRIGITFLGENLRRIWGSFCLWSQLSCHRAKCVSSPPAPVLTRICVVFTSRLSRIRRAAVKTPGAGRVLWIFYRIPTHHDLGETFRNIPLGRSSH